MDALKKWLVIWFTPHQTTTPKWMFSKKFFFKSSLLLNGQCGIQAQYVSQPAATTFAFSSVYKVYPSSMIQTLADDSLLIPGAGWMDRLVTVEQMLPAVSPGWMSVRWGTLSLYSNSKCYTYMYYISYQNHCSRIIPQSIL